MQEGVGVVKKAFSEEVTFELRLGWFKTKGIACVVTWREPGIF